jgi:hypothetical protein
MNSFKVVLLSFMLAAPVAAQAETVCGHLDKREIGPQCIPGRNCPQYRMLQYYIETDSKETVLSSPNEDTLNKIEDFANSDSHKIVCADGYRNERNELYVQNIYIEAPNRGN